MTSKRGRPRTKAQGDLTAARTRESLARAEKIEVLNQRLKADLLPADDVRHLWQQMLMRFRARVLQLPSKALPLLSAAQNQAQAKDILERLTHECLTELSELDASKIENVAQAAEDEVEAEEESI